MYCIQLICLAFHSVALLMNYTFKYIKSPLLKWCFIPPTVPPPCPSSPACLLILHPSALIWFSYPSSLCPSYYSHPPYLFSYIMALVSPTFCSPPSSLPSLFPSVINASSLPPSPAFSLVPLQDGILRPTSVSFTTNEQLYITQGTTQAILG